MNAHGDAGDSKASRIRGSLRGMTNPLAQERPRGRRVARGRWPVLVCMLALAQLAPAQSEPRSEHTLPLVTSASNRIQQGFVRIINHSSRAGTVQIHAIDDSGRRFGPISLDVNAKASVQFSSADLESGNRANGLSRGVGDGEGDWRLKLSTTLDIEPLAYVRTTGGFVTSMHDLVAESGSMRYHVPTFNPGSNRSQVSRLRLINPTDTDARVEIYGLDDEGERSGDVHLTVPGGGARAVSARELESGGSGLSGRLGDGAGKWHLFVSADRAIQIMNLLRSSTGHMSNLSTSTSKPDFAPNGQAAFDALVSRHALVSRQRLVYPISPDAYRLDFVSPGRIREVDEGETSTGRYTYQKAGTNTGRMELINDDGGRCTAIFLFDSPTTGAIAVACNDGETDAGSWRLVAMTASSAPDLVVQSPTVSPSSPAGGQFFILRATVRNQGVGRSAATTLRYYRSSDATISTSDTAVGTDPVSALATSGTSAELIGLRAPSSAGTYYYGACVDAVSGEPEIANNCSSAVTVTVGGGGGNTFGVGQAVTGIPTSGFWFPSVTNTGAGASYRFQGGVVTLGWRTNNPAAGIEYQGWRYTCETSGGCEVVNGVVTRGTIRVSGGGGTPPPPSTAPDLVVQSPTVSPSSPAGGQFFIFRATVRNQGVGRSAATTLRYYRSSDATISTTDAQVGTDAVSALSASRTSLELIGLTAPSSPGTYYYGACVDSVTGESDTANNCSGGVRVRVGSGGGSDDHSNSRALATVLAVGSSRSGQIETGGDVDYFRVQVGQAGVLTVHTTGSLDTKGTLEDHAGSVLAQDDDGGSGVNFEIERTVGAGTHYVKVEGYRSSDTGSYTLHASVGSGGGTPPPSDGSCTAGLVVNPGERCTYKGYDFTVSSTGRGAIAFFSAGRSIDARGSTINGVRWDFHASKNSGSNSWTIHQAD